MIELLGYSLKKIIIIELLGYVMIWVVTLVDEQRVVVLRLSVNRWERGNIERKEVLLFYWKEDVVVGMICEGGKLKDIGFCTSNYLFVLLEFQLFCYFNLNLIWAELLHLYFLDFTLVWYSYSDPTMNTQQIGLTTPLRKNFN